MRAARTPPSRARRRRAARSARRRAAGSSGGGGLAAPGDGGGEHRLDPRRRHGLRAAERGVALGQRAAAGQPLRQLLAHAVQRRGVARRRTHAQRLGGFVGERGAGAGEPAGGHGQGLQLPGEVAPAHGSASSPGGPCPPSRCAGLADARLDRRDRLARAVAPRRRAEPGVDERRLVPRQRQRETNVELAGLIGGDRRRRRRHRGDSPAAAPRRRRPAPSSALAPRRAARAAAATRAAAGPHLACASAPSDRPHLRMNGIDFRAPARFQCGSPAADFTSGGVPRSGRCAGCPCCPCPCSRSPSPARSRRRRRPPAAAPPPRRRRRAAKLGIRPARRDRDPARHEPGAARRAEGVRAHRREHRPARRQPAGVDPAAEHLELGRRHPRVGGDGEGLLRRAGLPADAGLRRRHHRVRHAGQPGGLRQVRRGRREDAAHLLDVRHDAGHPARRLGTRAVRRADRPARRVPQGDVRPRRHQLEGAADGAAERLPRHQGGARQAAGQPDLRRRRRRGADGHRPAQVGQGSPRAARRRRRDDPLRQPVDQRQRRLRRRLGRLRLRRADHLGHGVGPRADGVGHPRQQQARHRQPGVAAHQDAGLAGQRRRQHAAHRRLLRRHRAAVAAAGAVAARRRQEHGPEGRGRRTSAWPASCSTTPTRC